MQQSIEKPASQIVEFSLAEMAEMLIKEHGIHEGLYNLSVRFQIAVGIVGPSPESVCPGAMLGISHIGLVRTEKGKENLHTVNAAEVNPMPRTRQ